MGLFSKKESKYDTPGGNMSDDSSKIGHAVYILKKAVHNITSAIGKKFNMEQPSHYDLAVDEDVKSPFGRKQKICMIIFMVYGFVSGILGEQYAEYWCKAFQAFACNASLTSENLETSPLTIIVGIIIIFSVYLSIAVIAGCIYYILFITLLRNDGDDEIEMLQIAFMYCILEIVLLGLVCFAIPFNVFIFAKG